MPAFTEPTGSENTPTKLRDIAGPKKVIDGLNHSVLSLIKIGGDRVRFVDDRVKDVLTNAQAW